MNSFNVHPLSQQFVQQSLNSNDNVDDEQVLLDEDEEMEIKTFYDRFDIDGDGKIDTRNMPSIFRLYGLNPTESDIQEMSKRMDPDQSGFIEYDEFLPVAAKYIKSNEGQVVCFSSSCLIFYSLIFFMCRAKKN